MNSIQEQFELQINEIERDRDLLNRHQKHLPLLRMMLFLLLIYFIYHFLVVNDLFHLSLSFLPLTLFLIVTWRDNQLKKKIERANHLIEICKNEIKSLQGDFSLFDGGTEWINPEHPYAFDLDLFGTNSLFQSMNRTVTHQGKNRLADYFNNTYSLNGGITDRQDAIRELSSMKTFRQQIQLLFFGQKSFDKDQQEFTQWLGSANTLLKNRTFQFLRFFLPVVTNITLILAIMGHVIFQIPLMMVILQLLIVSAYSKRTFQEQLQLSTKVNLIGKYSRFLMLIEKREFKNSFLTQLKRNLSHEGKEPPSVIIRQLYQLLNWMDSNLNILAGVLLNGLFLFNIHLLYAIEKWKDTYREVIPGWFNVVGELDALSSLANFAYNHPSYCYPQPSGDPFVLEASQLGHPLIDEKECVTNSITIHGWQQYCIITGANMSGKSTFLRTLGANYLLAMMGAPVFAEKFLFTPVQLHSSIRTSDSLARKESFFYAELKRLKSIITELEQGKHVFILLDEILKGTNSRDKQAGSIALLEQLVKYPSVGLIATHDLMLGDLIQHYPDHIQNRCFEIQIKNNEMAIDYKLLDGVCQNLNATFLMRKMGILIQEE